MKHFLSILLLCLCGRAPAAEIFSIAQAGDLHAPAFITTSDATNLVPFILAHTNDGVFNIRAFISTGDLYEQDTNVVHSPPENGWPVASLQNAMGLLRSNGILTVLCNGNHDCDSVLTQACVYCNGAASNTNMLWNNIFPISFFTNQVGYIGTKSAGDSHNLIMSYTNGTTKVLFLTYKTLLLNCDPMTDYLAQTIWVSNTASAYPDHNVILLGHFFINNECVLGFTDSPGISNCGPGKEPFEHGVLDLGNLLFGVGGHDRRLRKRHLTVRATDNHLVDIVAFNTQGHTNNGAVINLFTFRPDEGVVTISTYDIMAERFMTNNDVAMLSSLSQGQPHNWTVPLAVPRRRAAIFER